ncbi:hypothetical protein PG989_001042 [Apiospora arundinis]
MSDRVLGGAMPHHHRHLSAGAILQPTFVGYISSTVDALVLFEACLTGHTSHVPRLPHDLERANLIRSGNVFIYEENSSGIKRWTDGVSWSPSRILRNFLLYRELDKPFQPGEKRAMEQTDKSIGVTQPTSTSLANAVGSSSVDMGGLAFQYSDASGNDKDTEKALGEPLVDSYQIKPNGLVKKTTSVQYRGIIHHLVSYYNIDDVIGPDNGPREEQGDVPDLGPLHPSHHFNLRGAGPDHDEDEIGGYMQYVSGVSFRHRSVHWSTDRRGPRAPEPARPDSSGHAIRRSPQLLGTINGAGAIRRNGPQAILARAGEGVASSQVPVARFQSGPYSGVSRVTITSGSRRTFRPGANIGPPDDPFQLYDISSPPNPGSCGYFGIFHVNLC